MARNQKLTKVIKGRTIQSLHTEDKLLTLRFEDGSMMTVKLGQAAPKAETGGTIKAVRQQETTLHLDLEDGSTLTLETAEPTASLMVRGRHHVLEYAD